MPRARGPKGGTTTITPGGFVKTASYLPPEIRERLEEYVAERRKSGATLSGAIAQAVEEFLERQAGAASKPK